MLSFPTALCLPQLSGNKKSVFLQHGQAQGSQSEINKTLACVCCSMCPSIPLVLLRASPFYLDFACPHLCLPRPSIPPLTPRCSCQVIPPSALAEWNCNFFHLRSEPRGQVGNVCFTLCNESHLLLSALMVIDSVLTPWFVFRQLLPSLHLAVAISPLLSVISSLVALPPSWAASAPRRGLYINSTVRSSSPAQME